MESTFTIKDIQESWNIIDAYKDFLRPDKDGTMWQNIGGAGGPAVGAAGAIEAYFHTSWFNRLQRFQSRLAYTLLPYYQSGMDNLIHMIGLGNFTYKSDTEQNQLDDWLGENEWDTTSVEYGTKLLVTGENFLQNWGNNVRYINPDYVYDNEGMNGVEWDETDYYKVINYYIRGEATDPKNIQHRALKWKEEKRGISLGWSILPTLQAADKLKDVVTESILAQCRVAWWRKLNTTKDAAQQFFGPNTTTQNNYSRYGYCNDGELNNYNKYGAGAEVTMGANEDIVYPSQLLDGDKVVAVLRANLRCAAARFGIPENVLSQDLDSVPAYNGAMVSNGYVCKGLRAWQRKFINWDKQLLGMCGFDKKHLHISGPEVAIHDKDDLIKEADFLYTKQLATKAIIAGEYFDQDYEENKQQIEKDYKNENESLDTNGENNGRDSKNNNGSSNA